MLVLLDSLTHLAELADYMFEDVARDVVEEGLQSWQVGALLQDALQSLLTLKKDNNNKRNETHCTNNHI